MAYADDERSVRAGDVVELYEFTSPLLAHRYTSSTSQKTHDGRVYTPLAGISNSGPGATSSSDAAAMTVRLPVSATVVTAHGLGVPPRSLRLRMYRLQARSGEARTLWDGMVNSITPKGRWAEARSVSQLGERLGTNIPSVSVQRQCNHFLGDPRCGVDLESFASNTLVSGISGLNVTLATVVSPQAHWFRAGKMVRLVDGEERTIVGQNGAGAVMTISSPFIALDNGDEVRIYPGCDHYIQTCQTKYDNKNNFGGHPSVPRSNPFISPVHLGST